VNLSDALKRLNGLRGKTYLVDLLQQFLFNNSFPTPAPLIRNQGVVSVNTPTVTKCWLYGVEISIAASVLRRMDKPPASVLSDGREWREVPNA
jgi:hypothetical protein